MLITVIALQMLVGPATWGDTFGDLPILLYDKEDGILWAKSF